ncbi:hypothetical protein J45TS6_17780 [Paenibacillus sp. J45TS6]|uniref:hypothetical protein n=1 Tax=unclassified Paenibacillus TaxID=185978 RepID=UPI001B105A77|nr:hypothetical protein [Paenibacillus sp. J45TS6]GIP43319.1 hypothetical protein J45TS6_17780 [Paenibacillus sp. J45TS6]
MEPAELIATLAVFLSCILLLIVMKVKRQIKEIQLELDLIRNQTGRADFTPYSPVSDPNQGQAVSFNTSSEKIKVTAFDEQLLLMVQQGQKIAAIKKLREVKDMDLKSAKLYVDKLEEQM